MPGGFPRALSSARVDLFDGESYGCAWIVLSGEERG